MPLVGAGNVQVTFQGNDLTPYLNQASQETVVSELDATDYASTGQETDPGFPGWSASIGGDWHATVDGWLHAAAAGAVQGILAITVGTVTYTHNLAFVSNYSWSNDDPLGKLTWSADLSISGAPVRTTA